MPYKPNRMPDRGNRIKMAVYVEIQEHRAIHEYCDARCMTASQWLRRLARHYLAKEGVPIPPALPALADAKEPGTG